VFCAYSNREVHGGCGRGGDRCGNEVRAADRADGEQVGGQQWVAQTPRAAEHGDQHGRPEQQG
jgi:hypothetical protein